MSHESSTHHHETTTVDPHAGHNMDDMGMDMDMKMYFHARKKETVLFDFWKTENTGVFICSLIIIFVMAFSYEALKYWRDRMYQSQMDRARSSLGIRDPPSRMSQVFSGFHIIQTILHMIQFVLSYFLMLIFMTYNIWLALAVTLGAGTGYFCFGWYKAASLDITEHCQ